MKATRFSSAKPVQALKPTKTVSLDEDPATASDALPLPLHLTNATFLPFSSRWFTSFFPIDSLVFRPSPDVWISEDDEEENKVLLCKEDARKVPCGKLSLAPQAPIVTAQKVFDEKPVTVLTEEDEEIIKSVVAGTTPSYSLELKLGDCKRAAAIRREALQRLIGNSLSGLPLEGFNYESVLGQCCEMPVGYMQIPVGMLALCCLMEESSLFLWQDAWWPALIGDARLFICLVELLVFC
ncbi:3-hydroxy-3-methylglutaryl-coenzyme A reductase 2 [Hibiscus syriacus]|uniref:3-hydroxy-3-methylglutaryl-coenzyme A reductase 2 n=1 Tax=Hibiscus syriacus TaxID=106335 RepID=A0A6A3BGE6_HIBSY|nr:3-hydroxy-3-methylglutaryl-coenzyme A reductase 2 [Hibiscus syriacus]